MSNVTRLPVVYKRPQQRSQNDGQLAQKVVKKRGNKALHLFCKAFWWLWVVLMLPIFWLKKPIIFLAGMVATWNLFLMLIFWDDPSKSFGMTAALVLFGAYSLVGISLVTVVLCADDDSKGIEK